MFDPLKFGENLKLDLAMSYIKGRGVSIKNFVEKLVPEDPSNKSFREKFDELIKIKGPYVQALDLPLYSEKKFESYARNLTLLYAQHGLYNELIETLKKFGIERLYDFQEVVINEMLSKLDNYLITAPTGRGKTESWLIPLLNFIISIKKMKLHLYTDKANNRIKTKIVLIYPTKALAQDQFKRLINYLYTLNQNLGIEKQISIGIYDGDTPHKRDYFLREILKSTYELFQCPLYDLNDNTCEVSCKNLIIKYDIPEDETSRRPHVVLSKERCEKRVNFNFIYLTREDIEENGVDILITNPDELNVQLININTIENRDIFIFDPIYYVLDEIHTYSGIFGAYLSMILKRLKACRINRLDPNLAKFYVIGASATIANKEELFSKIIGKNEKDFKVISAKTKALILGEKSTLNNQDIKILRYLCQQNDFTKLSTLREIENINESFVISKYHSRSNEKIQGFLYDFFVDHQNLDILSILMRHFHQITNKHPLTKFEVIDKFKDYFEAKFSNNLDSSCLVNLFDNLYSLGTYSQFLENRSHLFVWPIDGFYGCINCGRIYQNLRANCDYCGEDFITKISHCNQCSDIFYESWYCPECFNLFPSQINNEGLFNRFDSFFCPYEHEEKVECSKVIWKPQFKCTSCDSSFHKRNIPSCPNCSGDFHFIPLELMIDETTGKYFYCNSCENIFDYSMITEKENTCYNEKCGNTLDKYLMRNKINVKKCDCNGGLIDYSISNLCPVCGEQMDQKKILPWVCKNCGKKYFTKKPPEGSCKIEGCNSRTFYLDGFIEPSLIYEDFEKSSRNYLKIENNSIKKSNYRIRKVSLRNYCFVDQNFRIRNNIEFKSRRYLFDGKCEIKGSANLRRIGLRFVDFSYTPNFTSTRISQFSLRQFFLKDDNFEIKKALKNAKLLSFADSVRDMNLLAENFFESEVVLAIDQLVFNALKMSPNNTLCLQDLQDITIRDLDDYLNLISEGNAEIIKEIKLKIRNSLKNAYPSIYNYFAIDRKDFIEFLNEIIRRLVMNKSNVRQLVLQGIVDFDIEINEEDLSNEEIKYILRIKDHYNYPPTLNSFSYFKTAEDINKVKELKSELEKSEINDRNKIELMKDEIKNRENKIDRVKNNFELLLDGLVSKKYLIKILRKNAIIYYIDPKKIVINLVSRDNPTYYNRKKGEFIPKFNYRFLNNSQKKNLVLFNKNTKDRTDFTNPAFSQVAYLLERFYPCLLNSKAYKGETTSTKRRKIENHFKNGMNINYISSGPAMEVGIDIGDLNIMLLYGTPPNINSYLQRIGRAGRKTKKSLIISVSKRNPIDYYYYQKPHDLMVQNEQPVPINDKNRRVIKNSLVWSIFDYITSNYIIDWESD